MTEADIQKIKDGLEPFLEDKLKETVSHAKNSLLSEDSNLANHILAKMKGHIEVAIDNKLIPIYQYIAEDKDRNIKKDEEQIAFKKEIMPVIEMGKNVQGFGKVSLYILGFIASVAGAIYGILHIRN
jgi:hypothetical protein